MRRQRFNSTGANSEASDWPLEVEGHLPGRGGGPTALSPHNNCHSESQELFILRRSRGICCFARTGTPACTFLPSKIIDNIASGNDAFTYSKTAPPASPKGHQKISMTPKTRVASAGVSLLLTLSLTGCAFGPAASPVAEAPVNKP